MPSYSFLNEAWSDPVMVQDNSGRFIRNIQQGRDELDNQFKDKEKKYNFEEKPKVIKNTLPEYGVDDYQIYNKGTNKKVLNKNKNNFDNTFFDNLELSEEESNSESENTDVDIDNTDSDEEYQELEYKSDKVRVNKESQMNRKKNKKNIKNKKNNIEGSNKYIELKDYVHDLENKINDFKIDSLNKNQSIFGDVNTNEMIIFLALGLFTIMILDSFTKLGSKLKTHN